MNPATAEKLWDEFLERWPINALRSMSIDQYSQARSTDTFTYWLESKTDDLGSIWGGSAFKFGIYHRGSEAERLSIRGRGFGPVYAWYEKFGMSPEDAYQNVHAEIVRIAEAAKDGRFSDVEGANLGPAVKWKIAFLYQDRDKPALLPIFKLAVLQALNPDEGEAAGYAALYERLMARRAGRPLFEYATSLWEEGKAVLSGEFATKDALAFLQDRLELIKEPVKYMAGFVTEGGRQIGLDRRSNKVAMFVEPGDWTTLVPGVTLRRRYARTESRNSNLEANAPQLDVGSPVDLVETPTLDVLSRFCDVYARDVPSAGAGAGSEVPDVSGIGSIPGQEHGMARFGTSRLGLSICQTSHRYRHNCALSLR
jgi:5-methylcytosine-specific restriction protein B